MLKGWPPKSNDEDLKPYYTRKHELSVQTNCLLWGSRVVIPPKFRDVVLEELHDSHPGIIRMKSLARSYVWWPKLHQDIQSVVRQCVNCQEQASKPPASPLHPWNYPQNAWERIHIDYAGPFEGHMILIIVDAYSKFIDAHVMKTSTSKATIEKLRHTFALLGMPKTLVSDNGTPFSSRDFEEFCTINGIRHVFVAPYHAASNGLAERAVQTIKLGLKKCCEGSVESRLYRFLLMYHNTAQSTTRMAPSVLLNKRALRTRLDLLRPSVQDKVHLKQEQMKKRHDVHSKLNDFVCGDPVYVYNFIGTPKWLPGVIEEKSGPVSYSVQLEDGRTWHRHADHIRQRYATMGPSGIPKDIPARASETPVPPISVASPPESSLSTQIPPDESASLGEPKELTSVPITPESAVKVTPKSSATAPPKISTPQKPSTPIIPSTPRRSKRTIRPRERLDLWINKSGAN